MRDKIFGALIALSLAMGLAALLQSQKRGEGTAPGKDNDVRARVLSSKELRVGYLIQPPYLNKETSSGEMSGIFFDVVEELGRRLELKVVWVEEVNLATHSVGLDAGRYDMIAFPLWRNAGRAKSVAFSTPLFYSLVDAYVRDGDKRFDEDITKINDPALTISATDGELAAAIASADFPKAKVNSLPNLSDYTQLLLEVSAGKADVTFFNRLVARRYIASNPGKIREVPTPQPVRVFAECFILPAEDWRFRDLIDATLLEMLENGVVEKLFARHGESPDDYFFPALPYRMRGKSAAVLAP